MDFLISPSIWEIRDTLPPMHTETMSPSDVITLTNLGNVPIDLGFQITEPGPWTPGFYPNVDMFVLRLHINDEPTAPTAFSLVSDYLKTDIQWATSGVGGKFGPGGNNVLPPPYASPDNTENLWMQFVSPTHCTSGESYEARIEIIMLCTVRYHMP